MVNHQYNGTYLDNPFPLSSAVQAKSSAGRSAYQFALEPWHPSNPPLPNNYIMEIPPIPPSLELEANNLGHNREDTINSDVLDALTIARESPDSACCGAVCNILESALAAIWDRVQRDQFGYVMTKNEFAVFNYYQARFRGNPIAKRARRRYWENRGAGPRFLVAGRNGYYLMLPGQRLKRVFKRQNSI